MRDIMIKSDQLYTWSDYYENSINTIFKAKAKGAPEKTAQYVAYFKRLINRTLQTLWETGMQVPEREGAWTKILSFYQSNGTQTPDGLYPHRNKRQSDGISGQLSHGSRDPGGNLPDQSRAHLPERNILIVAYGYIRTRLLPRYISGRNSGGQYAAELIAIRFESNTHRGGRYL
jgi:hypothetical protein